MSYPSEDMRETSLKAYLIIATYNRAKWKALRANTNGIEAEHNDSTFVLTDSDDSTRTSKMDAREQAEKKANYFFPETSVGALPLPQTTRQTQLLSGVLRSRETESFAAPSDTTTRQLEHMWIVHSFHSVLHTRVKELVQQAKDETPQPSDEALEQRLDALFTASSFATAPGTSVPDPGIGWMAIVAADDSSMVSMVEGILGQVEPLWRMYDMEIIPLNNDETTDDIYTFMTPVNWSR